MTPSPAPVPNPHAAARPTGARATRGPRRHRRSSNDRSARRGDDPGHGGRVGRRSPATDRSRRGPGAAAATIRCMTALRASAAASAVAAMRTSPTTAVMDRPAASAAGPAGERTRPAPWPAARPTDHRPPGPVRPARPPRPPQRDRAPTCAVWPTNAASSRPAPGPAPSRPRRPCAAPSAPTTSTTRAPTGRACRRCPGDPPGQGRRPGALPGRALRRGHDRGGRGGRARPG